MIELLLFVPIAIIWAFLAWLSLEVMYNALFHPFPHRPYVFLWIKDKLVGENDA